MIHALLPHFFVVLTATLLPRLRVLFKCGHLVCSPSQRQQLVVRSPHVPADSIDTIMDLLQLTARPPRGFRCSDAGTPPEKSIITPGSITDSPEAPASLRPAAAYGDEPRGIASATQPHPAAARPVATTTTTSKLFPPLSASFPPRRSSVVLGGAHSPRLTHTQLQR